MNEIENQMQCPICKVEVKSDASIQKYCSLCGMGVGNNLITIKRNDRKINFCSETCKNKFLKLGFRSFRYFQN